MPSPRDRRRCRHLAPAAYSPDRARAARHWPAVCADRVALWRHGRSQCVAVAQPRTSSYDSETTFGLSGSRYCGNPTHLKTLFFSKSDYLGLRQRSDKTYIRPEAAPLRLSRSAAARSILFVRSSPTMTARVTQAKLRPQSAATVAEGRRKPGHNKKNGKTPNSSAA